MKTWPRKVKLKTLGLCSVVLYSDQEASSLYKRHKSVMPASTGFVCLFHGAKLVGSCGIEYARERITEEFDDFYGLSKEFNRAMRYEFI